ANELQALSDNRKRVLFLSYCGSEIFDTAKALVALAAVQTVSWDTIQNARIAMYCEFRDLKDLLLDRLVCGVRGVSLQWRLLAKSSLTLKIALDEAGATKISIKAMATIQKDKSTNNAHRGNTVRQDHNELEESTHEEEDVY
ncbi:hypothetical protein E2320_002710, partial [Naja naja]